MPRDVTLGGIARQGSMKEAIYANSAPRGPHTAGRARNAQSGGHVDAIHPTRGNAVHSCRVHRGVLHEWRGSQFVCPVVSGRRVRNGEVVSAVKHVGTGPLSVDSARGVRTRSIAAILKAATSRSHPSSSPVAASSSFPTLRSAV